MRFHVLIKPVSIDDHLIAKDLVVGTEINAVALRLREGKRELIEIKARAQTAERPDTGTGIVEIPVCRGQPVRKIWRAREFSPAWI